MAIRLQKTILIILPKTLNTYETMTDDISADQQEIVNEFITEARDLIDELEPTIIGLGQMANAGTGEALSPDDLAALNSIFRLFHSIKGGAGFLGMNNLVKSTHTAENLLDRLRNGSTPLAASHVDLLCMACDFTKEALTYIEEHCTDEGMAASAEQVVDKFQGADGTLPSPAESAGSAPSPPSSGSKPLSALPAIDLDLSPHDLVTPDTRHKFLQEADDLLQEIESDLLSLANIENDLAPLDRLYRNLHSLKGNCGFMGFGELQTLIHTEETIVSFAKDGKHRGIKRVADMLLELIDVIKETLAVISQGGDGDVQGLDLYIEIMNHHIPEEQRTPSSAPPSRLGDILVQQGALSQEELDQVLESQGKPIGELLVERGIISQEKVAKALKVQDHLRAAGGPLQGVGAPESKRQDIRVDLDKLDALINLIGEMVIAENMVIHNPDLQGLELERFNKAAQHMGKMVRELQEMAMIIRMMPISSLFRRMIRLVHDLSRKSGKKVDLRLAGENTEVDKTVIEKISDPLVHLIRNAMDHGLEEADERSRAGKDETGIISLSASHEEGEVLIAITDDGRGLDRRKLIQKGIEKGLVEGDCSQMSDQDAFKLIFHPGFSTADQITDISGRGVGMDVVRQNLEAIKGRVTIKSVCGRGTSISLRIPLTLAIIDGMLLRVGQAHYILPILSIRESFRPASTAITITPDGQELVRVRESLLPVVRLHALHGIEPDHERLEDGILIVLDCSGTQNLCLFVDELLGQQQTVIKGLSDYIGHLGNVSGVSGCTILGNGEVCLILDARTLQDFNSDH